MLSPLFIQLFGREVIDRLGLSGFDNADTLARSSPEQIAEDAGIPVALARRIVALAVESGDPAPAEGIAGAPGAPDASPDAAPGEGWSAMLPDGSHGEAGEQRRATSGTAPDDADPFIDQSGLVAWMGFATRAPGGKGRNWSVNDSILDRIGEETADEATPEGGVEAAAPADRPAPGRTPMLLSDSLWSFGRFEERPPPAVPAAAKADDDPESRPRPPSHPRRRKRDA